MAEARPAEREKRNRRIVEIIEAIFKHSAELGDLAKELDMLGCDCEKNPTRPDAHPATCPVAMAWTARSMAEGRIADRP